MQVRKCANTLMLGLGLLFPVTSFNQALATDQFKVDEKAAIEKIIRDYLLNNPQVVIEAAQRANDLEQKAEEDRMRQAAKAVRPVDAKDHLLGNPKSAVRVIEYSDFECPFCKTFHPVMQKMFDEYGKAGKVAWVYRHFPLDSIHSKSRKEAQASECATELGGNDAFWSFARNLFEVAPSNNELDLSALPDIAKRVGIDRAKFQTCLSGDERGGKYAARIEEDAQNASAAGGTGTPYTVVVAANGKTFPIGGATSYEGLKEIIDRALAEK